jgi:hypothetical protein
MWETPAPPQQAQHHRPSTPRMGNHIQAGEKNTSSKYMYIYICTHGRIYIQMPKKQDEGISSPYLNSIIKDTISGMSHDTQHQVMILPFFHMHLD